VQVQLAPLASWTGASSSEQAGAAEAAHPGEERRLAGADLDVSFYEGEEIDLAQELEDELMLASPTTLCEEDDQGRCLRCGKTLEEVFPEQTRGADSAAHPFAALRERVAASGKDQSRGK
ncbi:MAG TPA: YceD family protein, partial [bacterium]|nr:YceD family protein [bacterium]